MRNLPQVDLALTCGDTDEVFGFMSLASAGACNRPGIHYPFNRRRFELWPFGVAAAGISIPVHGEL